MWVHHCSQLLLLGVAFVNATPAFFYNKGFRNAAPSEVGCSYFTKEFDPYTGHITYRCNPDMKNNFASVYTGDINDKELSEDEYLTLEAAQTSGRSRDSYTKPMYQSFSSRRFQTKKNNKPKKPTYNRRNRCPPGQMFQSELDICIDYPLGPPLPAKRPNNSRQTLFDQMMADAPVRTPSRTTSRGSIRSLGKFNLKNRCKPNEIFVSEIGICLPKNNCFPYGRTC